MDRMFKNGILESVNYECAAVLKSASKSINKYSSTYKYSTWYLSVSTRTPAGI